MSGEARIMTLIEVISTGIAEPQL